MIKSNNFGYLKNGQEVLVYTLTNQLGMQVRILNYGGIIQSIKLPCPEGLREVVLAYESLKDYEENPSYLGAIIGRTAGRLGNGQLKLDDKLYRLSSAESGHLLHGGARGFHQKLMAVESGIEEGDAVVKLSFKALSKDDAYPSDAQIEISYRLKNNSNELLISLHGETMERSYLNLTNHSYFNLADSMNETIGAHLLKLNADAYSPVDESGLPLEGWLSVEGSDLDFRQAKSISGALSSTMDQIQLCKGIDHPFEILEEASEKGLKTAAILTSPNKALQLEVQTSQPHLVVYTGNYLENGRVPSGKVYKDYMGICFETQEKPNLINTSADKCKIVDSTHPYQERIKYIFHCS